MTLPGVKSHKSYTRQLDFGQGIHKEILETTMVDWAMWILAGHCKQIPEPSYYYYFPLCVHHILHLPDGQRLPASQSEFLTWMSANLVEQKPIGPLVSVAWGSQPGSRCWASILNAANVPFSVTSLICFSLTLLLLWESESEILY